MLFDHPAHLEGSLENSKLFFAKVAVSGGNPRCGFFEFHLELGLGRRSTMTIFAILAMRMSWDWIVP